MSARRPGVLVTGGTGTLGGLVAAALLREGEVDVVAPVRGHHPPDAVERAVAGELASCGDAGRAPPDWRARLHQVELPAGADDPEAPDPLPALDAVAERHGVEEVVHCAGCLSYFNEAALRAVNIGLTGRLVAAAKRWSARRFVHVSTAFASGYVDGPIPERLHDDPGSDPTFYTESKRRGERVVAESGVPFLILRPSIVIGDSRDGHYRGPRYGLYQLWSGVERFLLDEWPAEAHYVAPRRPIPLLHQDAFQAAFLAAWRHLPAGAICHVSSHGGPDVRAIAELFAERHLRPGRKHYYDRLADVPLDAIPPAQRAFLGMAAINIEISSRPWRFRLDTLDRLIERGLVFADATLESVARCQEAYFARSAKLARYRERFAHRLGQPPGPARAPERA